MDDDIFIDVTNYHKRSLMFSIQKIHYPDHAWHIIDPFWSNQGVQLQAFELKLGKSKVSRV